MPGFNRKGVHKESYVRNSTLLYNWFPYKFKSAYCFTSLINILGGQIHHSKVSDKFVRKSCTEACGEGVKIM